MESWEIWKDWYSGKDKDRDDDHGHDYGWNDKNNWDYKKNIVGII